MNPAHDDTYPDWLILSLRWSRDELSWYGSGMSGYTKNLVYAGRFTEAEAKREQRRVPKTVVAVHIDDAMSLARTWVMVDGGTAMMRRLMDLVATRNAK